MNLNRLYLTNNDCYKAGASLKPSGIMVHSTGAANTSLSRYVGPDDGKLGANRYGNHWNQAGPDGRQVCVHAFIGKLKDGSIATYQTLPWNMRGWHGGSGSKGSVNNTHIGFEICEDNHTDSVYFQKVYKEAVELCAYLCDMYGLDPLKDGVLICHCEGYKRGIASNHSDVLNWFPKFSKNMDMFRADVKSEILSMKEGKEVLASMKIRVDGGDVKTVSSVMRDGSNYPNLRELCDVLGLEVGYDANSKIVTIKGKQRFTAAMESGLNI